MQHETKFAVGQKVLIIDLDNAPAMVISITIAAKGTTYEVAWFHSGARQSGNLFEEELRAANRSVREACDQVFEGLTQRA